LKEAVHWGTLDGYPFSYGFVITIIRSGPLDSAQNDR
jgi:hypothetical protein